MAHKTLVIADDDESVREALKGVVELLYEELVSAGEFEVLTADDGVSVTEVCERSTPELVFMDVNMPRMDGIDAFYTIKEANGGVPTTTVFLTGFAGSGTVKQRMERAIADGASGYLFKPATATELKHLIDQFVFAGARGNA
jgi:CheY-like chemotaxis protein